MSTSRIRKLSPLACTIGGGGDMARYVSLNCGAWGDRSGSVTDAELREFFREMRGIPVSIRPVSEEDKEIFQAKKRYALMKPLLELAGKAKP